jgi:hypothetical protein
MGINLPIWLPTIKSQDQPDLLSCKWRVTYCWKALDEGYNFALDLISIGGLIANLWHPKIVGVPTLAISGFPFGSFETKNHLDVDPVGNHIVYYKGEVDGFPQVWAMVSLVCPSCLWLVLAPKVFQLCTNHFVLVLCRSMWVVEACQFFLVPCRSSGTPLYPSKVRRAKEHALTPCSSVVFCLGLTFESFKESKVCHQFPMWEFPWECEGSFPHSPTFPRAWNVTPKLPSWPAPL